MRKKAAGRYTDSLEVRNSQKKFYGANSRCSYDAKFKLSAVKHADIHGFAAAGRKFGVDERNVRRWKQQEVKLKSACPSRKSFRGPKKGRHPEVEKEVFEYLNDLRAKGMPVSRELLQIKAMQEATKLGLSRTVFRASLGWVKRFMRRHGLSLRRRTTLAQRLPNQFEEKLIEYQRYVISLRKKHQYHISQIANADQTPVYFDSPQNYTVEKTGQKSVLIRTTGNEKARITVMLAVTGDGFKLPPFLVLRRKTMPKESFPPGIVVRCQERGWMNEQLVVDWLDSVWGKRPGALFNWKSLLSLDAFRGHITEDVKKKIMNMNTDLVVIPGGMTSQLQVLDVVVNKPFKGAIRKEYSDWLISNEHTLTPTGRLKKPSNSLMCQWILSAWAQITPKMIKKGFLKCCLTNAMDGTEDDVLWNDGDDNGATSDVCDGDSSSDNSEGTDQVSSGDESEN